MPTNRPDLVPCAVTPLSCATVIDYANNDYSSLVSEASASLDASGTHIRTTIGGQGTSAVAGSGPTGTPSMTAGSSATASSVAGNSVSSAAQPSSSGGAQSVVAQLGLLGGAVLGAAVLL